VQPGCASKVATPRREASELRLVGRSGVAECPGDIEDSVLRWERGAWERAVAAPCGVASAETEKM
jgi:hypothetical protein